MFLISGKQANNSTNTDVSGVIHARAERCARERERERERESECARACVSACVCARVC